MAGLVPAIHTFLMLQDFNNWMPATSAGMTIEQKPSRMQNS
jgi:hypothetical protein